MFSEVIIDKRNHFLNITTITGHEKQVAILLLLVAKLVTFVFGGLSTK